MDSNKTTPLMQQWREVKERHPDALLFFRVGDFYEMFNQDAEEGARILDLTLTSRNNGGSKAPLCGIPVKAKDQYIAQALRAGRRVAICEQVEDPAASKGIVRREVVEVATPGAVTSDELLAERRNNYLLAIARDGEQVALAAADVSTGETLALLTSVVTTADEIARIEPSEILHAPGALEGMMLPPGAPRTVRATWHFDPAVGQETLRRLWGVSRLDGLGIEVGDALLISALSVLAGYVAEVQPGMDTLLRPPRIQRADDAMVLDEMTRRNLELVEPIRATDREHTVLTVLDRTRTPMGARLLRHWLLRPLVQRSEIELRHDVVSSLVSAATVLSELQDQMKGVRDIERLANKVQGLRATPREMRLLADSVLRLPNFARALSAVDAPLARELAEGLDTLEDVAQMLGRAMVDDAPANLADGDVIRPGFDALVDELRSIRDGATDGIGLMEAREKERTGIERGLKIGYNKVFGYYIEVTRANLDRVPEDYTRKQTIAGGERFVTPELKAWEEKASHAAESLRSREALLYTELRTQVAAHAERILRSASAIAAADALASLAEVAAKRGYVRPELHDGFGLEIRAGRHPVVETMLRTGEFIPNDVLLDDRGRIAILTGPNCAGKSTLLRQVGLIQLLAQVGSFVPAASARLPVADRIFTRVGASDSLAQGLSTFMVEMTETASILNGATARSLVLLDEIGRGTATWDGLSVATAVTEHFRDSVGAKVIFATHYHELAALEHEGLGIVNWNVAVREEEDRIVFLHNLRHGPASRSYGVDVGRMAGLPAPVVARAREVLARLERNESTPARGGTRMATKPAAPVRAVQLSFSELPAEPDWVRRLKNVSVETTTPLAALMLLAELRSAALEG